mmetsp:Transcript_147214/g.257148  ORF Transcript_147214/g.257148 Transcript_147214/m.257148 type:complete len:1341 (-) Transcript_147214:757-4779(-)
MTAIAKKKSTKQSASNDKEMELKQEGEVAMEVEPDDIPKAGPTEAETANIISFITFAYMGRLIRLGTKRPLQMGDIYEPPEALKSANVYEEFEKLWEDEKKKESPTLGKSILTLCKWDIIFCCVCGALYTMTPFTVPFLLKNILEVIMGVRPQWEGLLYAGIIYGMNLFGGIMQSLLFGRTQNIAVKVRSVLCCTIYKKSLLLGTDAFEKTNTGQVFNLIGQRVEQLFRSVPMLAAGCWIPLLTVIAFAYLFVELGLATFGGLVVMCVAVPFNYNITKSFRTFMFKKFMVTDKRMTIMNEVLQAIRVIKYYAWEDSFIKRTLDARRPEVQITRDLSLQVAKLMVSQNFGPGLFQLAVFVAYVLISGESSVTVIFTSIALLNMIRQSFAILPMLMSTTQTSRATLEDIKTFLLLPEMTLQKQIVGNGKIDLREVQMKWTKAADPVLKDVNFSAQPGELVMVVGKVGSGKTSLLNTILEEGNVEGALHVDGRVAYIPQQAWILNATVRDNILFNLPLTEKYHEVLDVVDLTTDMDNLPSADFTEIGEKGINVSGGQKQRISIARGVYQDADVYLMDDILSAVDVHVGQHIFDNCVNGMLKKKTRVLVTNQLQYLGYADHIYLVHDSTVLKVTMESPELKEMLDHHQGNNQITSGVVCSEVPEGVNHIDSDSDSISGGEEDGEETEDPASPCSPASPMSPMSPKVTFQKSAGKLTEAEDRVEGGITWSTYYKYLREFGGPCWFVSNVTITILQHVLEKSSQLWLGFWAQQTWFAGQPAHFYLLIYAGLIVLSAICVGLREVQFALAMAKPCWGLHERALRNVMAAPMSYFDTTPTGRIINRFTGDLQELDFLLPLMFNQHVNMSFILLFSVIAILIAAWWFIGIVVVVYGLYMIFAKIYTMSSLELRRLHNISKSPVMSHFQETLQGLSSIRAYRQQDKFSNEFATRLDISNATYFAERMSFEWMRFRCNQLAAVMIGGAAFCLVIIRENMDPSLAGLALSQAVLFVVTSSQATEFYIQSTNAMACVERLSAFDDIPKEETESNHQAPPQGWPSMGMIEIQDLSARYRANTPLVLKNVNLQIKAGENIGVVGRTGSGKSSMLLALYRMLMADGTITIDGVKTTSISRTSLRSRLSIIPQEPVLFNGTLRYNLDPNDEYTDEQLWAALELSSLAEYVRSQPSESEDKLKLPISASGKSLSVGQSQLLCLARAAVRRSKVLLLDEATASVDVTTDALIQTVIREHFKDSTVITIAHRLHTVLDCDKILVLDHGEIAEFDSPQTLAATPGSMFAGKLRKALKTAKAEKIDKVKAKRARRKAAKGAETQLAPNPTLEVTSISSMKGE